MLNFRTINKPPPPLRPADAGAPSPSGSRGARE